MISYHRRVSFCLSFLSLIMTGATFRAVNALNSDLNREVAHRLIDRYKAERDLTNLGKIVRSCSRELGTNHIDWNIAINSGHMVKVVCPQGKSAGFIMYSDNGHINYLAVDGAHRRKGYGTLLLKDAVNDLKQQGNSQASICVFPWNEPAKKCYERFGFRTGSYGSGFLTKNLA